MILFVYSKYLLIFFSIVDECKELKSTIATVINEQKGITEYEKLYNKAVTILHPYDSDFICLLIILFNELQVNKSIQLKIGKLIMKNYEMNLPQYHNTKGIMAINLTNVCHALALSEIKNNKLSKAEELFNEAKIHITNAENILEVSRGDAHPIMELCKTLKENIESETNILQHRKENYSNLALSLF